MKHSRNFSWHSDHSLNKHQFLDSETAQIPAWRKHAAKNALNFRDTTQIKVISVALSQGSQTQQASGTRQEACMRSVLCTRCGHAPSEGAPPLTRGIATEAGVPRYSDFLKQNLKKEEILILMGTLQCLTHGN